VLKRIKGIAFLGTPHCGADDATLLRKLLRGLRVDPRYVDDLRPDSTLISSLAQAFTILGPVLTMSSFYETNEIFPGLGVPLFH